LKKWRNILSWRQDPDKPSVGDRVRLHTFPPESERDNNASKLRYSVNTREIGVVTCLDHYSYDGLGFTVNFPSMDVDWTFPYTDWKLYFERVA
jgi:hypothetical protein